PFAIQILIENAIKHAFKNRKYNNRIIVTAYKTADGLYISVEDNGSGIPDDKINNIGKTRVYSDLGTGSALENLNHRLEGLFGIKAKMHIHRSEEHTSELQSRFDLVCRLLLETKNQIMCQAE